MTVKLRGKHSRYPDLTAGQPYLVIGVEASELRLLNDSGRPYLYPPRLFKIVDASEPSDWITEYGPEGERYAYPAALSAPGFFEDFFDERPKAVRTFWRAVNRSLSTVGQVA
jgi:hypothetical protein